MECQRRKVRIVGRSGGTLANLLYRLQADGEVSGLLVSDLIPAEVVVGICAFCANEPSHLVGVELTDKQEQAGRTRVVMAAVSLPLCSDCFTSLTQSLRLTVS